MMYDGPICGGRDDSFHMKKNIPDAAKMRMKIEKYFIECFGEDVEHACKDTLHILRDDLYG